MFMIASEGLGYRAGGSQKRGQVVVGRIIQRHIPTKIIRLIW